jgi:glycosyltransferase involved in cell wall biosynthesis
LEAESRICHHIKQFIVLHDVIPLLYHKDDIDSYKYWYNRIGGYLNKNCNYFCNSMYTKDDFLKYYGSQLDENKMIVVHHATSQIFYPDYDKKKLVTTFNKYKVPYKDSIRYIFSLCTMEPRKNLKFTVQCFIKFISKHQIQDLFFYLGGSLWDTFICQLEEQVDNFDEYRDRIIGLGYVDDSDVNILYSNSVFFVYLSQYEGFGTPPLEAMQAGTPVITSNNTSLPEVVGDAGIMVDYDSEEQCIKAFEDLYFNDNLREYIFRKALNAQNFFPGKKLWIL